MRMGRGNGRSGIMITFFSALFASICTVGNSFFTKLASGKTESDSLMKFNMVKS